MDAPTDVRVRELTAGDGAASWQLGRLAFGGPAEPPPDRRPPGSPGIRSHGAFDSSGRLVGKATDLEHAYLYGGRPVPGAGVAGVAVAPEHRGAGIPRLLIGALLEAARDRGAAISALFPTTSTPYRRLGWELAGVLRWTAVPTATLAGHRCPPGTILRAAEAADVPAILALYRDAAAESAGLLARTGPLFDVEPAAFLAGHDGHSVAAGPDGGIEGYASWDRGAGYDAAAVLTVPDLIGATPRATVALLAMLGSWRSVTPTLHLRLRPDDPVWRAADLAAARSHSEQPWMLRVIDAPAAVAARGWPAPVAGAVGLELVDDVCPWNAGAFRLELDRGAGRLTRGGDGAVRLTPGGLAALYSGSATPSVLRRSGLLDGGDAAVDGFLAAATAGPPPAILDYF